VGLLAILFPENVKKWQPLLDFSRTTVFLPDFFQDILFRSQPEIQFPAAGVPMTLLVAAVPAPPVQQKIAPAVMAVKRSGDTDEIDSDPHLNIVGLVG